MKLSNRLGRKKVRYANPNRTIGNSIQSKDCMLFFACILDLWRSIYIQVASDAAIPGVYHEMDYSSIVRELIEQLIAYHFNESLVELLSYSLETHACEFLKT